MENEDSFNAADEILFEAEMIAGRAAFALLANNHSELMFWSEEDYFATEIDRWYAALNKLQPHASWTQRSRNTATALKFLQCRLAAWNGDEMIGRIPLGMTIWGDTHNHEVHDDAAADDLLPSVVVSRP